MTSRLGYWLFHKGSMMSDSCLDRRNRKSNHCTTLLQHVRCMSKMSRSSPPDKKRCATGICRWKSLRLCRRMPRIQRHVQCIQKRSRNSSRSSLCRFSRTCCLYLPIDWEKRRCNPASSRLLCRCTSSCFDSRPLCNCHLL